VRRLRRHWSRAPALWQLRQSGVVCTNSPGWREARALCEDLPSGTGSRVGAGMGTRQRAGELGAHTRVNRSPLDRHCDAARLESTSGLARSTTGAAPGHVAEEGMCKRWTLLIVRCAHTDINEAIPAFLDTRRAGTPRAEGLRRSPSPHIGAGDMRREGVENTDQCGPSASGVPASPGSLGGDRRPAAAGGECIAIRNSRGPLAECRLPGALTPERKEAAPKQGTAMQ
jgi:hypothetical protein